MTGYQDPIKIDKAVKKIDDDEDIMEMVPIDRMSKQIDEILDLMKYLNSVTEHYHHEDLTIAGLRPGLNEVIKTSVLM